MLLDVDGHELNRDELGRGIVCRDDGEAASGRAVATPRQARLLSARAGNYQYHHVWATLLDQPWVC